MRRRSQADRIERASRRSWSDGHTVGSALLELLQALRELAATIVGRRG